MLMTLIVLAPALALVVTGRALVRLWNAVPRDNADFGIV